VFVALKAIVQSGNKENVREVVKQLILRLKGATDWLVSFPNTIRQRHGVSKGAHVCSESVSMKTCAFADRLSLTRSKGDAAASIAAIPPRVNHLSTLAHQPACMS
jgi:hypothetical protein